MPCFGQVNYSRTTASLMALAKVLIASGNDYYFNEWSYPDIAEVRNILTTIWFDCTKADHILFIDADMAFEPQLVLDMLALNEPVVGCFYPKRRLPVDFVGQLLPGDQEDRDGFRKVKDVGAGVLLIRRDCIAQMLDQGITSDDRLQTHPAGEMLTALRVTRIIRAFDPIETETGKLSEDKSFCKRHRDCGGEVWAAINHKIAHVGPYGFTGTFADPFNEDPQVLRMRSPDRGAPPEPPRRVSAAG